MVDTLDDAALAKLALAAVSTWPLPEGAHLTPFTDGANNLTLRVDAPVAAPDDSAGGTHVLRIYRNHADIARVRHEVALLAALRAQALPFALPAPVASRAGPLLQHLVLSSKRQVQGQMPTTALAVLWRYLPGTHPDPADAHQAEAAGAAAALLDQALATLDPASLPGRPTPPLGDLRRRLPLLDNPDDALQALPVPARVREALVRQWHLVEEQGPPLYARLPQQIVHGDFDPSNVLFDVGRVSGVLDFEFSGPDLRVIDLLVPLNWWPLHQFGTGAEWPIMEAIGRGYTAHLPLLAEELQALPALFRLRAIGGMLHRIVRYRQGLMTTDQLLARVAFMQERVRWLRQHERRLLTMVGHWQAKAP